MLELSWKLLIGALAGGFARYALRGRNPGGLAASVTVGMVGSFAAAYLGERYGWYREGDSTGLIMCGVGAVVLLVLFRFLSGTSANAGRGENYDL
jgi:uncharacterized membrane protein YeaQ/YmgE (transglycosylase-associated protein family)